MLNFRISIIIFAALLLWGNSNAQTYDLNFYLDQAIKNSPLINQNKSELKIINLDLQQVENLLSKPEINLDAGVLFAPIVSHDNSTSRLELVSKGAENYTGYDLASTDGGQYHAFVSLNQPLFNRAKRRSFSEKSAIGDQKTAQAINLTIHELQQLVRNQYILCLKSKKQSEISQELVNTLAGNMAAMKNLVDQAIYRQTDFMLLQLEYQNFKIEYNTFFAAYEDNLYDLNLICGIADTVLYGVADVDFKLTPDTVLGSQFLNTYRLDSLNILAQQNIYELKYRPQLNFFANAGLNAIYQPAFNRFGFSTGLTFSWNIFDGNQRKLEQEKSAIRLQTLAFDRYYFLSQRNQYKNKTLHQIQSLNQRIMQTGEQLKLYEEILQVYHLELRQGEVSVTELKNILKDMAAKKQDHLLLEMEKMALINTYNYWNF